MLDRVLGPASAVVLVPDTIRTSTSSTTSVRWGSAVGAFGPFTPFAVLAA